MPKDVLDEREFELINIIGQKLGSNQRDISHYMDMSLGMINMLIKRLISKGYIRIEQLNKKKVQYLLTPKGFAEKMRKSVKYTINTINSIGLIKDRVKSVLSDLHQQGHRTFYIYSQADLTFIVEGVLNENGFQGCELIRIESLPDSTVDGVVLLGKERVSPKEMNGNTYVNLLTEIAKENHFMNSHTGEK